MIEFSMLCLERLGFKDKMEEIVPYVDSLHCDIMDGEFVESVAFSPQEINSMNYNIPKHVHIMSRFPIPYIDELKNVNTVSFHFEAVEEHAKVIDHIRHCGFKPGLVVNPETPIASMSYLINSVDRVLLMAVNPGFSAQPYIDSTSKKITELRNISPTIEIVIDGGMNENTMKEVISLGADAGVVCSVILKAPDHQQKIQSLKESCLSGISKRRTQGH